MGIWNLYVFRRFFKSIKDDFDMWLDFEIIDFDIIKELYFMVFGWGKKFWGKVNNIIYN